MAWVPDPSIDPPEPQGAYAKEGGQRVGWRYWREAHAADAAARFREIQAPTLVFFATDDAYVSPENQQALIDRRQPHQRIEMLAEHTHGDWTYAQAERVLAETTDFLIAHIRYRPDHRFSESQLDNQTIGSHQSTPRYVSSAPLDANGGKEPLDSTQAQQVADPRSVN